MELILSVTEITKIINGYLDLFQHDNIRLLNRYCRDKFPVTNITLYENEPDIPYVRNAFRTVEKLKLPSENYKYDLPYLPNLRRLSIYENCFVPGKFTQIRELELLTNSGMNIDLNCLVNLSKLTYRTNISLEHIGKLTKLKVLICERLLCQCASDISLTGLTGLTKLKIIYKEYVDGFLPYLTKLTELKLRGHEIRNLNSLPHLLNLERLTLEYGINITTEGITLSSALPKLKKLHCWFSSVDTIIPHLTQLTELKFKPSYNYHDLFHSYCPVDNYIKHLTNLKRLRVSNPISEGCLVNLINLEYFEYSSRKNKPIKITGKAFRNLLKMKEIRIGNKVHREFPLPAKFDNLTIDNLWE
jgi:hypothetical protein